MIIDSENGSNMNNKFAGSFFPCNIFFWAMYSFPIILWCKYYDVNVMSECIGKGNTKCRDSYSIQCVGALLMLPEDVGIGTFQAYKAKACI